MFPSEFHEEGIRRVLTPREAPYPYGFANATEPTPEDLVPTYEEYRIGVLDTIVVSIEDLVESGRPWQAALEVSTTGYVRVPYLGPIKVLNMTEQELEQELRTRVQEAGLVVDPIVQVVISLKRSLFFSAIGDVGNAGPFVLAQPDTRLLDVIGQVGDIGPNARKMYVIRRNDRFTRPPARIPDQPLDQGADDGLVIPPPLDEDFGTVGAGSAGDGPAYALAQDQQPPDDFERLMRPQRDQSRGRMSPLVVDPDTGDFREPADPASRPARASDEASEEGDPFDLSESEYDWEDVPEFELSQRVIEIDVKSLKTGDPRYNIVVRNRDVINVPQDTGLFYMMGEVARPGVYAFGGREITIKRAIGALGGGLTPLAWPQRCEIVRRIPGTDKQITIPVDLDAVYAGLQDDVLLREDDLVNVGTHFVAPFLFVIRNSFRFTYGFGFVYDRNFGDQDSIGGRQNPETVERARRAQLGLPF